MTKLKILSIFLLSACLLSCGDGSSKKSADGYVFEEKEYEKTQLTVEIVVLKDNTEFQKEKNKYAPNVDGLQAFGRLIPSQNKCILYIKDPEWNYAPEFIGHELSHCIWGRWHEKRNAESKADGTR